MLITGFLAGFIIGIIFGCFIAWNNYKKDGVPPITIYKIDKEIFDFKEVTNNEE